MPSIPAGTIYDATAVAALVTFLVSLFKPFVETLTFGKPEASTHDAALRLLNVLLNVAAAFLVAASRNGLDQYSWAGILLQGIAQAAGSGLLYQTVTKTSGAKVGKKLAPAVVPAVSAPVMTAQPEPVVGEVAGSAL